MVTDKGAAMTAYLLFLGIVVLLYAFVIRAGFFHKSLLYPEHAHPFHYWWDRIVHRRK
ncbi:hypothetical protein P3W85_30105 [Cupriavidus basilensis]|uniref:Uncharacterized protein n=1 Tax=Cupriavidus basilensis TaxID=68895 RepID=A0ABT6AXU5_9BURK|nr:hypothetical protein [Cupriavidus basilensis]MDF3837178.1 hypothetical protein [Cupriavidus basilensis]